MNQDDATNHQQKESAEIIAWKEVLLALQDSKGMPSAFDDSPIEKGRKSPEVPPLGRMCNKIFGGSKTSVGMSSGLSKSQSKMNGSTNEKKKSLEMPPLEGLFFGGHKLEDVVPYDIRGNRQKPKTFTFTFNAVVNRSVEAPSENATNTGGDSSKMQPFNVLPSNVPKANDYTRDAAVDAPQGIASNTEGEIQKRNAFNILSSSMPKANTDTRDAYQLNINARNCSMNNAAFEPSPPMTNKPFEHELAKYFVRGLKLLHDNPLNKEQTSILQNASKFTLPSCCAGSKPYEDGRKESATKPKKQKPKNRNLNWVSSVNLAVSAEVQQGILTTRIVFNTKCSTNLDIAQTKSDLLAIKALFREELPTMPPGFVRRQVYNPHYKTMILVKNNQIIGAICFITHLCQDLVELVFCAVISWEQGKGYGNYLMCHFKDFLIGLGNKHVLSYVNSDAEEFFQKQGFSDKIPLNSSFHKACISAHSNATLMHLEVKPKTVNTNHKDSPPKDRIQKQIKKPNEITYTCLDGTVITISTEIKPLREGEFEDPFNLEPILKMVRKHSDAWPFRNYTSNGRVPVYYFHIKQPMDLKIMDDRIKASYYKTPEMFSNDMNLIFQNCREYNAPDSTVYRCGENLQRYYESIMPYTDKGYKKNKRGPTRISKNSRK